MPSIKTNIFATVSHSGNHLKTDKRVKNGTFGTLLCHKRATPRVDVTVMTRTRIYEKYHNVGWRNKKLALYQIPLSSSTAVDRRSCTVTRDPPADARSSIVTRCKRRQKCARLNFSRMNHRFRGTHWRWPPFCTPFRNTLRSVRNTSVAGSFRFHPRRALYLRSISVGRKDLVYHVLFNFHSCARPFRHHRRLYKVYPGN